MLYQLERAIRIERLIVIDSLLYILYVFQMRDESSHKLVDKFTCYKYFTATCIHVYNCINRCNNCINRCNNCIYHCNNCIYRCNNCIYRCTIVYIAVITVYMYITVQLYTHAWDKQSS